MKALICTTLALVLAAPAVSFAQTTDQPVTRAEVRADLIQLESAGWRPTSPQAAYPNDIQTAEARVHSGDTASGYGGATENGTSMSQSPTSGTAVAPVSNGQ